MLKSSWVRNMKWSYLNHQTIVKVWEFLKPSSWVFVILDQPCVKLSTLNSLYKQKKFDLHKLFKWKIVQYESCRKLTNELTIKIWIILDKPKNLNNSRQSVWKLWSKYTLSGHPVFLVDVILNTWAYHPLGVRVDLSVD